MRGPVTCSWVVPGFVTCPQPAVAARRDPSGVVRPLCTAHGPAGLREGWESVVPDLPFDVATELERVETGEVHYHATDVGWSLLRTLDPGARRDPGVGVGHRLGWWWSDPVYAWGGLCPCGWEPES